ncbi:amino acid adenylation domain-containing protein [Gluconobacter potus]|uniref:amino acid adenylation domain-containing protein n=1 Tax=Gluconobacter potus TaxID=2724927 RepID=UPI0039ECA660
MARLIRATDTGVPETENYALAIKRKGALDGLALVPVSRERPGRGEVEIEVRASGMNFRDVLNALGMYPGEAGPLGSECAGVVTATGEGVTGFAVGDEVLALSARSFGLFVVTDARLIARIPQGLSFEQAATIPVAFLTAWYALHDLAKLQAGERVLVHAAAGGVGIAAVQVAQWIGAEVLGTASTAKWDVVRSLGVEVVADSRDVNFAETIRRATAGAAVDVVLDALSGEFVDAGLSLLGPGGRFIEMGKTDIRDEASVSKTYPGVRYRAFDMSEAGFDRLGVMLGLIVDGFEAGRLTPLPVRRFALTEAEAAFRFMAQARHVGKLALVPPRSLRPAGTVVITGGLGALGLHVGRHLARRGVKHLVLTSRRGLDTPGAVEAIGELQSLGARVTVAAVDVTDLAAVTAVLSDIPADLPLRGVVHAAGLLDDGVLAAQSAERFAPVLSAKVDGAAHLDALTRNEDLDFFVLFSSATGTLGSAGQGGYAAANACLDALASRRRAAGLPAQSLAWGLWTDGSQATGLASGLDRAQQARLERSGLKPVDPAQGIALFDAVLGRSEGRLLLVPLDLKALRAFGNAVPPLWRELIKVAPRRARRGGWATDIASLPEAQRLPAVLEAVRGEIARVLSLPGGDAVEVERPLKELGLDSLMSVELRNRFRELFSVTIAVSRVFEKNSRALAQELMELWTSRHSTGIASVGPVPELPPDPRAPFPLTPIQQAYWVGRQTGFTGKVAYHGYLESESSVVDPQRLEASWRAVVARHEALRMVFTSDGHQRVLPSVPDYILPIEDLRDLDDKLREQRLAEARTDMSCACRSLEQWPLFEFRVFLLPEGRIRYWLDFDFLCLDGASLQIVLRDWKSLYDDPTADLPVLMHRGFEAVVRAGIAARGTEPHQKALAYWKARRPDFDPVPALPLAISPELVQGHRNIRYVGRLSAADWEQFGAAARDHGVTPTMALCGAFTEVLSRWSGAAPFLLNMTHFTRPKIHSNIYNIAGDFTNLLFLECRRAEGTPFHSWTESLQRQLHQHLEHSAIDGVEVLRAWRQAGRDVIVPVVFTSLLGLPVSSSYDSSDAWLGEPLFAVSQTPQVWLDHIIQEVGGELRYSWDVVEQLFPKGMIEEMMAAYTARITSLARDPTSWGVHWPTLLSEEQQRRIAAVNETAGLVSSQTLHGLFETQAIVQPNRSAVITKSRTLTYGELDAMARCLGSRLRALGARINSPVAIVMDKGWEQVVAVLGVLYSGSAYVPIDAGLPAERRRLLLERSGARLALVQPWLNPDELGGMVCLIVRDEEPVDEISPLEFVQKPTDLAYIIYTSGSTGEPKGVMLDHRGPVNYVLDINARLGIGSTDRTFGLSSLSFDLSVYDMFGIFAAGGALVLPEAGDAKDPALWAQYLRQGITVWNSVPALLGLLVEYAEGNHDLVEAMGSLNKVMLSGDWIPVSLPDAFRSQVADAAIISVGGATETSINSILYSIGQVDPAWSSIPWGRPMANQTAWILGPDLEPCPTYVPGEIHIGGCGLAQGYWNDEERTRERFILHPRTGERLYRTGDWGRWLPNGDIEFLGRRDQQVKVHGYRVELGEIESLLERHSDVRQAVVVAVGDREKRLVAHVVLDGSGERFFTGSPSPSSHLNERHESVPVSGAQSRDILALRQYCQRVLPGYMVPVQFQICESLPRNANGKVDRTALAKANWHENATVIPPVALRAEMIDISPDELMKIIMRVAVETFSVPEVQSETPFTDLGVDSLLALRFRDRLGRVLNRSLPVTLVYDYPSVSSLVRALMPDQPPVKEPTSDNYAKFEVSAARRLKVLEEENERLKRLLAESALDISTLKKLLERNRDA